MTENKALFIEQAITGAVRETLSGRVNELLEGLSVAVPLVEFDCGASADAVSPVIVLNSCERTEKERLILLDAYTLTVTFSLPETPESALFCYAYVAAFEKALCENPTLGGVVNRAAITGKKYVAPKKPRCGDGWEVVLTLRITVEEMAYAG